MDLFISIVIWASGVGMTWVGIQMANHPPTTNRAKRVYLSIFGFLGIAFVCFSIWQFERTEQTAYKQQNDHQQEQLTNEGHQKYMQSQLDSLNGMMSNLLRNSTPEQIAAAVRGLVPRTPAPKSSVPIDKGGLQSLFYLVMNTSTDLFSANHKWMSQESLLSDKRSSAYSKSPSEREAANVENMRQEKENNDTYNENERKLIPLAAEVQQVLIKALISCGYSENDEDFRIAGALHPALPNSNDQRLPDLVSGPAAYLREKGETLRNVCGLTPVKPHP